MQRVTQVFSALYALAPAQPTPPLQLYTSGLSEPWLSVIGGGFVAAVVTLAFNAWWDTKNARSMEDWEFKRYRANLIHYSRMGLMDAFFGAKTELEFLAGTLETMLSSLELLAKKAEEIIKQAGGQDLTVAQLEERKKIFMQPVEQYNSQQVQLRWNQYEQKAKELQAKAESILSVLKPLVPPELFKEMAALYGRFSAPWVWNLPNAKARLEMFKIATPDFLEIQSRLARHVEVQLGRKSEQ